MNTTHTPMKKIGTTVRLHGGGGFDVRGCDNAEQLTETIVRACNAHDQLVAALHKAEAALGSCYNVTEWPADGGTDQDAALKSVRAALTAAGAA